METSTDKLVQDLKTVIDDAEELLEATASQGGEQISRIRARAGESVRTARKRVKEITHAAQAGVREVDARVHDNAWTAVGVAAGAGLLFGYLLGRK